MGRIAGPAAALSLTLHALPATAAADEIYLNDRLIAVYVGSGTGEGTANNTFSGGRGIDKVIDAPSADAEEIHTQATHIWYTFADPADGLELIFDFDVSYDVQMLHFWNYSGEGYDVDRVDFTFYDTAGDEIGSATIEPALGAAGGITAEDIPLKSPLNTRTVRAMLTSTNGQIDFQNIGFTATLSDPALDPPPKAGEPLLGSK